MATVVNDRETGLASSSVRIISPDVYITATSNTFGNLGGTITPDTITLTANTVSTRANSIKNWYCANSDAPASWVLLASGTGNTYAISKEAFLAAIGTNSTSVLYKCVVTEPLYSDAVATYSIEYNDGVSISTLRYLDILSPVVFKTSAGALESGTHTSIVATAKKTVGTALPVTDTGAYITITANGVVRATTATLSTLTVTPGNADGKTSYLVELWDAANTSTATLLDSDDVPVVFAGSNGITAVLSNDSHSIPTNYLGGSGVYTGSGTNIYLYEGASPLTYNGVGTTPGTWTLSIGTGVNITASASITNNTTYATIGDHSNVTSSTASVTYTLTGKTKAGVSISVTKTQTFSRLSAGVDPIVIDLSNDSFTVATAADGTGGTYGGQAATSIRIYRGGVEESSSWTISGSATNATGTLNAGALAGPVTGVSAPVLQCTGLTADNGYINITATKTGSLTQTITFSGSKSKTGLDSVIPYISVDAGAVNRTVGNAYTPATVNFNFYSVTGTAAPVAYTGYYKYYIDNGAGYGTATTGGPVSTLAYSPSGSTIKAIKVELYKEVGLTTKLDTETVSIVYDGATGSRTAIMDMYQWAASAPTTFPVGSSTYTWATGQFTDPATLNGWSRVPPVTVLGQTLYIARTIFVDSLTTATSSITWSATAALPAGASGINGQRVGFLEVYRWAVSAPTGYPSGSSTYTWATGAFTAPTTANGWSLTPGSAVLGQTLWAISVRVSDALTTATSTATWDSSTVYPIGASGSNGSNGKSYVIEINGGIRNVTFDANGLNPSPAQTAFSVVLKEDGVAVTPSSYTWTSGGHLTYLATDTASTFTPSCAATFVASNNDFVKVVVVYGGNSYTQTIPIAVTKIGTGGAAGAEGSKSTTVTAFAWGGGTAPTHTGTSDYVWATGAYSAPSGWATSAGTGSNGQTLYQLSYTIVALASATTSTVQWGAAATVNTIGFRQDGSVGVQGAGARKAYIVMLDTNTPTSPDTYAGDGVASTAVTGSYGPSGWSTTLPTVPTSTAATTYVLWLSDGNYYPVGSPSNAGNTVWGTRYLSTFKVDSLQAVSANLGNVKISTTGSLFTDGKGYESGNGIFIGYNSSLYRLDIGSPSQYLRWTGSALNFTGNLETTGMVKATGSVTTAETNTFSCITGKSTGTYASLGDKYVAGVYGFSESYTGVLGYGSGDGMGVYALADGGNWAVKALGPIYTNCNIRISGDPTADTGIELMGGAIALGYSGDHGTAGQCLLSNGTGNLPYWGSPAYATAAGSATNATYATSAGSATNATYATSAGSAGSAGSATTAGTATNVTGAGTVYTTYVSSASAEADCAILATGGGATHGLRGVNTGDGTSGLVGVANGYDFYADGAGNYGPFTGSHEGVLLKTSTAVLGDILLDNGIASRKNISNAISELSLSNTSNSKKVVGVLSSLPKSINIAIIPSAFKHVDGSIQESYNAYRALYNIVSINSVGEGQMNVCGENGNLEIGDLISTSSIPGKGMKQYDDVVRNITVAKCRENVTFSSATEVKMVACIYMCG